MRVLFLINFYPPFERGGQGRSCQQVVEGLKQRGHEAIVLTSMNGTNNLPVNKNGIYRWLYLEMDPVPWQNSLNFFYKRKQREKHNIERFQQLFEQFKPDIVFIWGMWNIPRSLPAFVEAKCPGKVVYRFADYWPTLPSQYELYWRTSGRNWFTRLPKQVLRSIALRLLARDEMIFSLKFEHTVCVSAATRDILVEAGIPISNARIIYTGLSMERYLDNGTKQYHLDNSNREQTLKLLYAGRLSSDKGVETVINALAQLVYEQGINNIKLSLAGAGSTEYTNYLKLMVAQKKITEYVSFLGYVPHEEMPELLRKFDVLVVPSVWQEPFARVVLEGMASGLVVVASSTGGTSEIVIDKKNGLLFPPGDSDDLAQKILSLVFDQQLHQNLAQAGQQTVIGQFTTAKMIDEFENYLQQVVSY